MNPFDKARSVATLLWRVAVLALLAWNLHEVRQARAAAEDAQAAASQAIEAVGALGDMMEGEASDDQPAEQPGGV